MVHAGPRCRDRGYILRPFLQLFRSVADCHPCQATGKHKQAGLVRCVVLIRHKYAPTRQPDVHRTAAAFRHVAEWARAILVVQGKCHALGTPQTAQSWDTGRLMPREPCGCTQRQSWQPMLWTSASFLPLQRSCHEYQYPQEIAHLPKSVSGKSLCCLADEALVPDGRERHLVSATPSDPVSRELSAASHPTQHTPPAPCTQAISLSDSLSTCPSSTLPRIPYSRHKPPVAFDRVHLHALSPRTGSHSHAVPAPTQFLLSQSGIHSALPDCPGGPGIPRLPISDNGRGHPFYRVFSLQPAAETGQERIFLL